MERLHTVWLDDASLTQTQSGFYPELLQKIASYRIDIAFGFLVTRAALAHFLRVNNLSNKIVDIVSFTNTQDENELESVASHVQNLILQAEIPPHLRREILYKYELLPHTEFSHAHKHTSVLTEIGAAVRKLYRPPTVTVLALAQDNLPEGEYADFPRVTGDAHLLQAIRQAWASLYTASAIKSKRLPDEADSSILVQRAVSPRSKQSTLVVQDNNQIQTIAGRPISAVWAKTSGNKVLVAVVEKKTAQEQEAPAPTHAFRYTQLPKHF